MSRKEKIRLVRVLVLSGLILGGGVVLAYFEPQIRDKSPDLIREVQKKIEETELGKTALKILGMEIESEVETKKEEEKKSEETENKIISKAVQEKIKEVIREKGSEKIIEILKTLPPEEFEQIKKELQEEICEEK